MIEQKGCALGQKERPIIITGYEFPQEGLFHVFSKFSTINT